MALKHLAIAAMLALLAACSSVEVQPRGSAAPVRTSDFAEAQALARTHASLTGQARSDNAARIDALLARLDNGALSRGAAELPVGDPLYTFAGRALLNRGLPLPRAFDRGDWRFDAAGRPPADRDGYRPPMKVALLLPLSGSQASAAAAVRDGFLSGYYGEQRRRPEVRFYDTAAGAGSAYARAIADGNDFVVGPLGRDEVDAVFSNDAPPVPLLALNRGSRSPPAGSASFSLSPEDEGITAAEYLVESGARRVLVVAGNEDSQRRTAKAFVDRLQLRGAQVAGRIDYSAGTALVLAADAQPDAVFLALKGNQARAFAPQLNAAGLAGKPRVATSQISSGTGKSGEDLLLDGILFPTETWGVHGVAGLPSQASVASRIDTAKGAAARLFAFGFDAWLVTAYLERLALSANAEVPGATGRLSLDGVGNVLRRPSWSRFSGGEPVPLADGAR